ncbi:MAG: hypothetical protein ACKVRP_02475 [Bacteroidota bacterium]
MPQSIIEITSFEHVIAIALQRKLHEQELPPLIKARAGVKAEKGSPVLLTFSEIWSCCKAARVQQPAQIAFSDSQRFFASNMFEAIKSLEKKGIVWSYRAGELNREKLIHIGLTAAGITWLKSAVFSHQDRAPQPEPSDRSARRSDHE